MIDGTPLTLEQVKAHLRVLHDQDDTLIEDYTKSSTEYVEVRTRRTFAEAAKVQQCYAFPPGNSPITLPDSPVASIVSIEYYDLDGATASFPLASVGLITNAAGLSVIQLEPDEEWPDTQTRLDAVTITYQAGYADAADVPQRAKQAILYLTYHCYDQRTPVAMGIASKEVELTMQAMCASLTPGIYPDP